uniref:Uncharacterized protein n=1 Tax=Tanacetum cinerariifolium TaxID=118510 RepID=A0A6L2KPJ0_TANCI|nr:hypothetical protein [Tanacetum cinerariifolium]
MDCAINDLASKFTSMSTMSEEIKSAIKGGSRNYVNHGVNKHGDHRFYPNNDGFFDDHMRPQSPNQYWGHFGTNGSSEEEGDNDHEFLLENQKECLVVLGVMYRNNGGQHGYRDRKSDSEVEKVFNENAGFIASMSLKSGSESRNGTKILLEQWRETKVDDDYDIYDDDLYDTHDMFENLQSICDD